MRNLKDIILEKILIDKNTQKQEKKYDDPTTWDVGDILCGTWGYSMTLPSWYKIIHKTNKMFELAKMQGKIISGHRNGQWKEIADENAKLGRITRTRINKFGRVVVDRCTLHLWDGETPLYGDDMD